MLKSHGLERTTPTAKHVGARHCKWPLGTPLSTRNKPWAPLKARARSLSVQAMRVYCVSDLHTDYKENFEWCEALSSTDYKSDTLIVAGDISDDLETVKRTLGCLTQKWATVFFTPGNHELWVRKGDGVKDSFKKWEALKAVCGDLGVHYKPKQIDGVWICPIFSWYHGTFDTEPDVPGAADIDKMMVDFAACKWPEGLKNGEEALARRFDNLNEPALSNLSSILEMDEDDTGSRPPVITFSHFLPLQALLPEKRMLFQPNLAKAVGSSHVAQRIEELRPLAHVFGHTHFLWDSTIGGVRYVQWCLGTPREQRRRSRQAEWRPLLLYDTVSGLSPKEHCYWSAYYEQHERDPLNLTPAPWAKRSYNNLD